MSVAAKQLGEGGRENPDNWGYVPDPDERSTWKLPLVDAQGNLTARQVGMAVAALGPGGFRGNRVEIPSRDRAKVKRRVLRAWRKVNPDAGPEDVPEILKQHGGRAMEKEVQQQLDELETNLAKATEKQEELTGKVAEAEKRAETAEKRLEALGKLSAEDRATYEGWSEERQGEFLEASGEARVEMLKVQIESDDLPPAVQKQLDELQKQLTEAQKRSDEAEAREKERAEALVVEKAAREKVELAKKAEEIYPHISGSAEEKGAMLFSLQKLADEERAAVEKVFVACNEAIGKGTKPVGNDGGQGAGMDAYAKMETEAAELAKAENISKAEAMDRVLQAKPELYTAYRREQAS